MFRRKGALKVCSKFTGEHPCGSVISIHKNHISVWVFSCKFAAYFQNIFSWEHLWLVAFQVFINVLFWWKLSSLKSSTSRQFSVCFWRITGKHFLSNLRLLSIFINRSSAELLSHIKSLQILASIYLNLWPTRSKWHSSKFIFMQLFFNNSIGILKQSIRFY